MATGRVSKRAVDALKCKRGQDRTFLWDDAVSGFGVTAFPSGKKVFVAQYRHNGRSRRVSLGEYGRLTPEQARSNAKKVLGAVESGSDPIEERRTARGVRTFKELSDEFLRLHVEPKRKARTAREYERLLTGHILPAIGSKSVAELRRVDVARLHTKLSDHPYLANRCLALISSIWNWAARQDEVEATKNPAKGIERNPEKGRERYLTSKELSRLGDVLRKAETEGLDWDVDPNRPTAKHLPKKGRKTVSDPYAVAAIRLLILTGARLSEILNMRWDYVDWDRGIIFLPDSKTGKKPLYPSPAVLSLLNDLPRVSGNPHVIVGAIKGAARVDLNKPWAAIKKAAKLEGVRIHDLRHSYASIGAGASLGLPVIGKLLGHSKPASQNWRAENEPTKQTPRRSGKKAGREEALS